MKISVYIPLAYSQSIAREVFFNLAMQSIECSLIPFSAPGLVNSNHDVIKPEDRKLKAAGEVVSRNLILDHLNDDEEFFCMMDRDIVHLDVLNIENCLDVLKNNPFLAYAAVPLFAHDSDSHIRTQCIVCRTSVFKKIRFRHDSRNHICPLLKDDVVALGFGCRFIKMNGVPLIKEICSKMERK